MRVVEAFYAEGWHLRGHRADPLIADHFPGFRVETDYRTVEELAAMPVQRDFLAPHGLIGGAGSMFQVVCVAVLSAVVASVLISNLLN